MTTPTSPTAAPPVSPGPHRPLDLTAGLLSYTLPGMGQLVQGRVGKGVLFFVVLHAMFFYGLFLCQRTNVYLPTTAPAEAPLLKRLSTDLLANKPFFAQFWIGAAAWPALYEYFVVGERDSFDEDYRGRFGYGRSWGGRPASEALVNRLQSENNKRWDLGWVYTIVAGMLNVLVIYDALAGPAHSDRPGAQPRKEPQPV